jgi:N-acetylglucosamine kinase-like BadF-type ATPase
MNGDCVVTIEAGGTKCEALLMTVEGAALGFHAVYPAAAAGAGGYGRGREGTATLQAVRGALQAFNPEGTLHLVTSGFLLSGEIRNVLRAGRVLLWNAGEAESALAWAGVDEGLVALSGTGAFGHLRVKDRVWHADGLGPLLGDRGGAYQIGREGLRAVFRPGGADTALREELVRFAGLSPQDNLEQEMVPLSIRMLADRTAVAHYAAMVDRAARAGDPMAVAILEQAADDLAGTLKYLVGQADVAARALPMIGSGGVIRHSDIFWERLVRQVAAFLPRGRPIRQDVPQVVGRALAGLGQVFRRGEGSGDLAASRERLLATLPPLLAAIRPQQETPLPRPQEERS